MSQDGLHQVTPPSAVILNERKYPVVFESPSFSEIFGNFRTSEYKLLATAIAVGAPVGYYLGWKFHLQRPSMWLGVAFFGSAALAHASQVSAARLMGILPNEAEVQDYLKTTGKGKE